jgi:small-conductance mechanosensitive channel
MQPTAGVCATIKKSTMLAELHANWHMLQQRCMSFASELVVYQYHHTYKNKTGHKSYSIELCHLTETGHFATPQVLFVIKLATEENDFSPLPSALVALVHFCLIYGARGNFLKSTMQRSEIFFHVCSRVELS